jgi:ectoine hydroxylase-related dioxygenase (phytanoyl-CoA dioxygenase family)
MHANIARSTNLSFFENPEAVLSFYHEHGYHIEYNVYSDDDCHKLIEAAYELEAAKKGNLMPAMMPHRENETFLFGMKNPKVKTIISHLVGGIPSGLQSEFFYCKPGTRGFSLHQDNFYVEAEYGVFASAWAALTDTYPEKGGLIVYPGSHKEGDLPTRKLSLAADLGQDPNANNEETIVPEKYTALSVSVPKGAVLFIHGHLVHGSNPNKTQDHRYVLLTTYIKQHQKFRPGHHAKRAEIDLT